MPGAQVKDWALYHKLKQEGKSDEEAARIANFVAKKRRKKRAKKK